MSYETLKQFSINLKDLTVKYSYSSNNLRDWRDRLVVEKVEKTFESKKIGRLFVRDCIRSY